MTFDSLTFVVFFAIVLGLHHAPFSWSVRKKNLLVASYLFYAAWNPPFVLLLLLATVVDWFFTRAISRAEDPGRRKWLLAAALILNLGALSFFKYGAFLLENFVALAASFGILYQPPQWDIVLPIGISFYTFHSLSYTIDVYRRQMVPIEKFRDYALFVAFFPQLVAGPIMRAKSFLPQLTHPKRASSAEMGWGLTLLTCGLFLKVVLADYVFAPVVDAVYRSEVSPIALDAWTAMFAFVGQVYCDLCGYSLCAAGAALCLGFHIPENFHFPYGAIGVADFWRRWHISLSTWLGDYLYGGLRRLRGGRRRIYSNVLVTMLLGGLWHGAAWTFVAWGGAQGVCLIVEHVLKKATAATPFLHRPVWLWPKIVVTFLVVSWTAILFRAVTFSQAWTIGLALFGGSEGGPQIGIGDRLIALTAMGLIVYAHGTFRDRSFTELASTLPVSVRIAGIAIMSLAILTAGGNSHAFIYFQF